MRDIQNYSTNYNNDNFSFERKYQAKYRRKNLLKFLKKYPHNKILEIGCGMESIVSFIDFYSEIDRFVIVEPSNKFYNSVKEQIKDLDKVTIVKGFFEDKLTVLKNYNFDFIIVSSLLHEVENPDFFMSKLFQLANTGTIIHINVPNAKSFHRILGVESGIYDNIYEKSKINELLQQNSIFDLESLTTLIMNSAKSMEISVNVLNSGSYFIKPFTHFQMEMCLKNKIFDENILEGFNKMIKYFPENGSELFVNFKVNQKNVFKEQI